MFELLRGRRPSTENRKWEYPFYPHHVIRNLIAVLAAVAVTSALAGMYPAPLESMADPIEMSSSGSSGPPMRILRPAWLLEKVFPVPGLSATILAAALVLFLIVPVLDRRDSGRLKERLHLAVPFFLWMAYLFIAIWLIPERFFLP